jgi:biopolymer transport protein ExbB/TolQ
MNEQKGIIVLFMLVSLASMLLLGTAVFYQALYAFASTQKRVQVYQHEYALDGLINHAINQCRAAEHAHAPITHELSQTGNPWISFGTRAVSSNLVITPAKSNYTITATVAYGSETKKRVVSLSHNS